MRVDPLRLAGSLLVVVVLALCAAGCPNDRSDSGPAPGTDSTTTTDSMSMPTDMGADTDAAGDACAGPCGCGETACGDMGLCCTANQICVVNVAFANTYECQPVPMGCDADRSCACAGMTVCMDPFTFCTDTPQDNTVHCECPTC